MFHYNVIIIILFLNKKKRMLANFYVPGLSNDMKKNDLWYRSLDPSKKRRQTIFNYQLLINSSSFGAQVGAQLEAILVSFRLTLSIFSFPIMFYV